MIFYPVQTRYKQDPSPTIPYILSSIVFAFALSSKMILSRVCLLLALTSLVTSASIPPPSTRENVASRELDANPAFIGADAPSNAPLHQDKPVHGSYFLSESIPDDEHIAEQLAAMREAGFLAKDSDHHPVKSTKSSPTQLDDISPSTALLQDWIAAMDQVAETQSAWDLAHSILPPLRFLMIASTVIAVLTIIRGCLQAHR